MNTTGGGSGWSGDEGEHSRYGVYGDEPGAPPHEGPGSWDRPPSKGGGSVARILGILVIVALIGMGACGACAYIALKWGSGVFEEQVESELRDDPVVLEHIGELESVSLDLRATGNEPELDVYVFDVQGTTGSGRLVLRLRTDRGEPEILSGRLELEDGRAYELDQEIEPRDDPEPEDTGALDDVRGVTD